MLLKTKQPLDLSAAKRGDSMIEIMFAVAVFSLVAVLTIVMMNVGMTSAENSLELVTARNELNAQAEALRFIHSSYISELTLPTCDSLTPEQKTKGEKCQQYEKLWKQIISNAMDPADYGGGSDYSIPYPLTSCREVYDDPSGGSNLLAKNKAFILNTRRLNKLNGASSKDSNIYISAADPATSSLFQPAPINARIIFTKSTGVVDDDENNVTSSVNSIDDNLLYDEIGRAEGIWVVAVKDGDGDGKFYDFYIESCWYSSGDNSPTSLDAVIRLLNPQGL